MANKSKRKRVSGETGSDQNKLRGELYADAFNRCEKAMKLGCYFETIVLCDSMISDRIEALHQAILRKYEPNQSVEVKSIGTGICNLKKVVGKLQPKPKEYDELSNRIKNWADARNESVHGFVKVTNESFESDIEARMKKAKDTAIDGMELFRVWDKFTKKEIRRIKSN